MFVQALTSIMDFNDHQVEMSEYKSIIANQVALRSKLGRRLLSALHHLVCRKHIRRVKMCNCWCLLPWVAGFGPQAVPNGWY